MDAHGCGRPVNERRFGYFTDTPDARDLSIHDSPILGLAPVVTSDEVDYRKYLPPARTQLANSCVGYALTTAAYGTAAIAVEPIEMPSPLFPYTMSRLRGRPARLVDVGCSPRDAMLGIAQYGLVANARWPEVEAFINAVPSLDAFAEGDAARIEAFYRIPDGKGAAAAAKAALKRGRLPIFGMLVDQAYAEVGDGIYSAAGGSVLGGHMQCLVGFAPQLDAFLVANSWGSSFANEGYAWLAADFFESSTFDKWVVDVVPPEIA